MAEPQLLIFFRLLRQAFDFLGHGADAAHAHEKHGGEHLFGVFADGGIQQGGQAFGQLLLCRQAGGVERVHQAFACQGTFGKAGALQIGGGAALGRLKHGVAD